MGQFISFSVGHFLGREPDLDPTGQRIRVYGEGGAEKGPCFSYSPGDPTVRIGALRREWPACLADAQQMARFQASPHRLECEGETVRV